MADNPEIITQVLQKVEELQKRQDSIQREISDLQVEIRSFQAQGKEPASSQELQEAEPEKPAGETELFTANPPQSDNVLPAPQPIKAAPSPSPAAMKPKLKSDLEKFIGENLINKIGIAVTVIGVGIGAKYAIDHKLISPLTRIILGYLVGLGLFGFAYRLKKQYGSFSAVLLSGSMAIMYFITYAAFAFYDLIPLMPAFLLMVLFTVFTVAAAIDYNRQVIAHIGLVGAYAVPFLLSDGSDRVIILFGYVALINVGILCIAFLRRWKPLNYSSFVFTWLIFISWYKQDYLPQEYFTLALAFISVFFATFYMIFLANKVVRKEKFEIEDVLLLLANSGLFYALGYAILKKNTGSEGMTGLFTLGNAIVHFAVAAFVWLRKPADRGLLYFIIGLGLVFVTIAIPVQLEGHWVPLLWSCEAAALFWTGRTKNLAVFELLSYPLMFIAFFSLVPDWLTGYHTYDPLVNGSRVVALLNIHFLTSLIVAFSFAFILYIGSLAKYLSPLAGQNVLLKIMEICIPAILLMVLYFSFFMEINTFWNQWYMDSLVTKNQDLTVPQHFRNEDLLKYNTLSIFNYSMLFLSILSLVNIKWLKKPLLGIINLGLNTIALGVFLTLGLYTIGELRESFLTQTLAEYYSRGIFTIAVRYLSFVFAGMILFSVYRYVKEEFIRTDFRKEFDFLLHITLLTIISNELINWMDLYQPGQSYKLGLSILFGVYALLLVALGIWKNKVHLRMAAIVLFAGTLLKLFFYDLSSLDTISKTIVFVILGVLLLIISFLYNKYKALIFDDGEEKRDT